MVIVILMVIVMIAIGENALIKDQEKELLSSLVLKTPTFY